MAPTYLPLGELKTTLGVEDREWDDQLIRAIAAASRFIERFCNDQFAPDQVATPRVFRPGDGRRLTVGSLASTTGVTVEVDNTDDGIWDTTLAAGEWTAETAMHRNLPGAPPDTLCVVDPVRWPDGRDLRGGPTRQRGLVRVTARWGWATTPDDVAEACQILAAGMWSSRRASGGFAAAVRGLSASAAQTPEYALQAQNLLNPLRRPLPTAP